MTAESFLDGRVMLWPGDCLDVLLGVESNSIDAAVTDAPYGLGFMGKAWDHGVPGVLYWKQVLRVLKPGGHLLSFGGTRTYHRMICAIEDAGFEIRDMVAWLYGSGFNKNGYVSYKLEAQLCERLGNENIYRDTGEPMRREPPFRHPDADKTWGLAGAIKPAIEPICMARKPLIGTVAENLLRHGTGALNIDGCRVGSGGDRASGGGPGANRQSDGWGMTTGATRPDGGRWPANVIHDGSEEVLEAFPSEAGGAGKVSGPTLAGHSISVARGALNGVADTPYYGDSGSAARFFYTAKADADDRLGSRHPTVKPLDLMQYLVRLVTPPGGLVLDPFAGTGTTGEAAFREGMRAILIEREPEYQNDIRRRMALCLAGPAERKREAAKARPDRPFEAGSLFAS